MTEDNLWDVYTDAINVRTDPVAREGEVWVWSATDTDHKSVVRIEEEAGDHPDVVATTLSHPDPDRIGNTTSMAENNLVARVHEGESHTS